MDGMKPLMPAGSAAVNRGADIAGGIPRAEGFPQWGFALVGVLALMLGANAYMVWLSLRGHRDLVRSDYYDAGLDQDGIITRTGLARSPGMDVALRREGLSWRVETMAGVLDGSRCRIRLYRPDDGRDDKDLDLGAPQSSPAAVFDVVSAAASYVPGRLYWIGKGSALRQGAWMANLVWERDGKPIMEESFRIHVDG